MAGGDALSAGDGDAAEEPTAESRSADDEEEERLRARTIGMWSDAVITHSSSDMLQP